MLGIIDTFDTMTRVNDEICAVPDASRISDPGCGRGSILRPYLSNNRKFGMTLHRFTVRKTHGSRQMKYGSLQVHTTPPALGFSPFGILFGM